jgi:hypothetical protein
MAMTRNLTDTHPEAEKVQIAGLRSLAPWRKLEMVSDLTMAARKLALAGLCERFPAASPEELHRRLATLCLGPKLATKVYGPEPDPPTML